MHAVINQKALHGHAQFLLEGLVQIGPADAEHICDAADTDRILIVGLDVGDGIGDIGPGTGGLFLCRGRRNLLPPVLDEDREKVEQAGLAQQRIGLCQCMMVQDLLDVREDRGKFRGVQDVDAGAEPAGGEKVGDLRSPDADPGILPGLVFICNIDDLLIRPDQEHLPACERIRVPAGGEDPLSLDDKVDDVLGTDALPDVQRRTALPSAVDQGQLLTGLCQVFEAAIPLIIRKSGLLQFFESILFLFGIWLALHDISHARRQNETDLPQSG